MSKYLLISSRDPFESKDAEQFYELARSLARDKHTVSLFLVQNGVLPARQSDRTQLLTSLLADGAEVLVDEFSLKERGIVAERLGQGLKPAPLDVVLDQLADGRKTLWN